MIKDPYDIGKADGATSKYLWLWDTLGSKQF